MTYLVVVNGEEQYSIWPEHLEVPAGWRACGVSGTREECLAHIEEVWTDMRPLSVRANRSLTGPRHAGPGPSESDSGGAA